MKVKRGCSGWGWGWNVCLRGRGSGGEGVGSWVKMGMRWVGREGLGGEVDVSFAEGD